jgi:hypothetical protein
VHVFSDVPLQRSTAEHMRGEFMFLVAEARRVRSVEREDSETVVGLYTLSHPRTIEVMMVLIFVGSGSSNDTT